MPSQDRLAQDFSHLEISDEFRNTLDSLEATYDNLFITGRAGTGKSTLLEYFRSTTKKKVVVLAPTGVAALNVKGQTIHSFFHFRPGITPHNVRRLNRYNSWLYKKINTIIIDEISMVRADLLDCIDRFMRVNGKNPSLPFGGVQMVFIGDLYQLPPVVTNDEKGIFKSYYKSPYFFDANSFVDLPIKLIELKKHYRQTDKHFIDILNSVRDNSITKEQLDEINTRLNPLFQPDASNLCITLTTTNKLAEIINNKHLESIQKKEYTYSASISGVFDKKVMPTDNELIVKEGAQIMMLNNDTDGRWVNGSIGKITNVINNQDGDIIIVEIANGLEVSVTPYTWDLFKFTYDNTEEKLSSSKVGSFRQYPMMLAWAVTIHKSQGKTFDNVIIDIGYGTFAHGQLYVALSRCKTLGGITLRKPIEKKHILMDPRIVDFLAKYERKSGN